MHSKKKQQQQHLMLDALYKFNNAMNKKKGCTTLLKIDSFDLIG